MTFTHESTTDEVLEGVDLSGRRIVITGAASGLGEESTRALAAHGASVLMLARDPAKNEEAAARIRAAVPDAELALDTVDLADLSEEIGEDRATLPVDGEIAPVGVHVLAKQGELDDAVVDAVRSLPKASAPAGLSDTIMTDVRKSAAPRNSAFPSVLGGVGIAAAGIAAALFLLLFILFAAPLIEQIPLAALVGVMFMVVIGTFEWSSFRVLRKVPKSDALVLVLVSLH